MKFHFLLLITFPFLFLGCSKEKSRRWMVADITVLDYYTHQPIVFSAEMTYVDVSYIAQSTDESVDLGDSDENGHLVIKERTARRNGGYKLVLHPRYNSSGISSGMYSPWLYVHLQTVIYTTKLDPKGSNKMVLSLKPYRTFQLQLNNTNCSGPTDTLWVNFPNGAYDQTFRFIGCQDTIYGTGYNNYFNFTQDPTINVHVVSKKNGVISNSDQTFNLNPGFNNMVEIDY